jgi:hypothetical protein
MRGERDDRGGLLRMSGCEQEGESATEVTAEDGRRLGSNGSKDRSDVVHPVLERPTLCSSVRQPPPEVIEEDEPRERGQSVKEVGEGRVLPHQAEVGGPAEQEDEIVLALTDHLVGEA